MGCPKRLSYGKDVHQFNIRKPWEFAIKSSNSALGTAALEPINMRLPDTNILFQSIILCALFMLFSSVLKLDGLLSHFSD